MTERARQNWSAECETAVNNQIQLEYYASHYYHALYCFFRKDNIGLEKIAKYFKKSSDEEREHAEKFMDYQTKRGGTAAIGPIDGIVHDLNEACPQRSYIKESFVKALGLEKAVNESLLGLHRLADQQNDPAFCDFLESEFLSEQNDANYELARYIAQLNLIGHDGFGLWQFANTFDEK